MFNQSSFTALHLSQMEGTWFLKTWGGLFLCVGFKKEQQTPFVLTWFLWKKLTVSFKNLQSTKKTSLSWFLHECFYSLLQTGRGMSAWIPVLWERLVFEAFLFSLSSHSIWSVEALEAVSSSLAASPQHVKSTQAQVCSAFFTDRRPFGRLRLQDMNWCWNHPFTRCRSWDRTQNTEELS